MKIKVLCWHLQGMELRQAIGLDNVVIHLDTYHMNIEERSMTEPVAECGAALGCAA